MDLELGSHVRTSDDHEAGVIDRLIIDPTVNLVRAAVLHRGFLRGHNVEVPVALLQGEADGLARLTLSAAEVNRLPEFAEVHAAPPLPADPIAPTGAAEMPLTSMGIPLGMGATAPAAPPGSGLDQATREEINLALEREDLEQAILGEGNDVLSRDGQKIGHLHRLQFDPLAERITGFSVRRGVIMPDEMRLPASLIAGVSDRTLTLSVAAEPLRIWDSLVAGQYVLARDGAILGTIERRVEDRLVVVRVDETGWLEVPISAVDHLDGERLVVDAAAATATAPDRPAGTS